MVITSVGVSGIGDAGGGIKIRRSETGPGSRETGPGSTIEVTGLEGEESGGVEKPIGVGRPSIGAVWTSICSVGELIWVVAQDAKAPSHWSRRVSSRSPPRPHSEEGLVSAMLDPRDEPLGQPGNLCVSLT